jgi:hypothetical protein
MQAPSRPQWGSGGRKYLSNAPSPAIPSILVIPHYIRRLVTFLK